MDGLLVDCCHLKNIQKSVRTLRASILSSAKASCFCLILSFSSLYLIIDFFFSSESRWDSYFIDWLYSAIGSIESPRRSWYSFFSILFSSMLELIFCLYSYLMFSEVSGVLSDGLSDYLFLEGDWGSSFDNFLFLFEGKKWDWVRTILPSFLLFYSFFSWMIASLDLIV